MLDGGDNDVLAFVGSRPGDALDSQVVGLGATGGKYYLLGCPTYQRGYLSARFLNGIPGAVTPGM